MKTNRILMITAAVVMTATSAMANSPVVGTAHTTVKGPDIIVYTDRYGNISKDEFLSYQSKRYDEAAANNKGGRVLNDEGRAMTKAQWLAYQSDKFDKMDVKHTGEISKLDFEAAEVTLMQPAAGGSGESTSRPQANNQAIPTSNIPGGADGAGGWTAQ